ncbi:MAG TPA: helix-turn-helix domain-containing protein [Chloroflexota bacterium]|nr:helix-turn-helix domain-containing protein [Chloroflexota bacterium]
MPIDGYYTTKEAAELLGLTHAAVKHAVWRGAIQAEQIARRHLIPLAEIERYGREVQGTQGWEKRKQPDYQPNQKQRKYQQAYYQRRKAARTQPATESAERDD